MAKNLANLLTDIVKRAKLNTDDRKTIKAALENSALSSIEVSDEDYDSVFENLHNLETAENVLKPKITNAVKAETLNGIDSVILEIFGDGLDDSEVEILKSEKTTPSKIRKGYELQKKRLETKLGKAKKDGDDGLVEKLQSEIEKLNNARKTDIDLFKKEKDELISNHKKQIFESRLKTLLSSREDIADDFKQSRHFAENFRTDLNDFFAKKKIEINHDNDTLLNSETQTPFMTPQHEKVDLPWAITSVVKEYGYEKKSKVPETVEIDLSKDPKGSPDFLKKSLQKINRED